MGNRHTPLLSTVTFQYLLTRFLLDTKGLRLLPTVTFKYLSTSLSLPVLAVTSYGYI